MSKYLSVIREITDLIEKEGVGLYVKKWEKPFIPRAFISDVDFVTFLDRYIKSYHYHSFIEYDGKNIFSKKRSPPLISSNPNPHIVWFSRKKIGYLGFEKFPTDKHSDSYIKKFILVIDKMIANWLNYGMNGLIIDIRTVSEGNMWPLVISLSRILGNTTLFAESKSQTTISEKSWCNLKHAEPHFNQRFLTSKLKFWGKIVILVSNKTANHGEIFASIFSGRSKCRIIGHDHSTTAGYLASFKSTNLTSNLTVRFVTDLITTINEKTRLSECIRLSPQNISDNPISTAKKWISKKS